MRRTPARRRLLAVVASMAIFQGIAVEAMAAGPAQPAAVRGTVVGETFDPMLLASGQALSARARENAKHVERARLNQRSRPGAAARQRQRGRLEG